MLFPTPDVERAFFRSRVRVNVGRTLLENGPLYARQLQRLTGHASQHIAGALEGDGRAFAFATSMLALGVVVARPGLGGKIYDLTPRGRFEVASALSRDRRARPNR